MLTFNTNAENLPCGEYTARIDGMSLMKGSRNRHTFTLRLSFFYKGGEYQYKYVTRGCTQSIAKKLTALSRAARDDVPVKSYKNVYEYSAALTAHVFNLHLIERDGKHSICALSVYHPLANS